MNLDRIMLYCARLRLNNDRTWFHENHDDYEEAKKDFAGFLDLLRFKISEEAPDIGESIMYMEPKEWMYRVARDMRFHKNGPPYNPSFRAYVAPDRKSWIPNGYYIRLYPGDSCFGTGLWVETTQKMNDVRTYISKNFKEFENIIKKTGIVVSGDKLKNMPRGFSPDDPAAEYIKMKNWVIMYHIPDEDITDFEEFSELLRLYVKKSEPMRRFLLEAAKYNNNKRPDFEW